MPRKRPSIRDTRVRSIRSQASIRFSGGNASAESDTNFDRNAAHAEGQYRTEGRIARDPDDQLAPVRPRNHLLHQNAG